MEKLNKKATQLRNLLLINRKTHAESTRKEDTTQAQATGPEAAALSRAAAADRRARSRVLGDDQVTEHAENRSS